MATRVQARHAYATSGAFSSNVTAGNLVIVAVSWGTGAVAQDSTISDTRGTSYTRINTIRVSGNFTQLQLYYGFFPSSGACTISIGGGSDMGFTAVEYSGIAAAGLIVTSGTAGGANGAPRITLQGYAGGLLFGAYANETSGTAKPNFTATGMTEISWDGSHLDGQHELLLSSNSNAAHGYNISPTYNNQAYIQAAFGHFTQPTKNHTTDAFLRKAVAKVHTTDALLRKPTTKVHTTDAMLRKVRTTTHTTDSILAKRYLRTHTTNSYLLKAVQKTHTTNSNLRKAYTRAHTTNATLSNRFLTTHTTDARIIRRPIIIHSTNSMLYIAPQLTHTTDAYLKLANYNVKPRMGEKREPRVNIGVVREEPKMLPRKDTKPRMRM